MSRSEIKANAKLALHGKWEVAIITLFLFLAIDAFVSMLTLGIGSIIVFGPLSLGLIYIYYAITKGNNPGWKSILAPFRNRLEDSFLAGLIVSIVFVGPLVLWIALVVVLGGAAILSFSAGMGFSAISTILLLLLTVAGFAAAIYLTLSYAAAFFILMCEPQTGGMEALKKSRIMMKGRKVSLIAFDISFIGWFILGFVTVLAWLYVLPYYFTARVKFIEKIYEEETGYSINVDEVAERFSVDGPYNGTNTSANSDTIAKQAKKEPFERNVSENGTESCKACGAALPQNAKFCGKCGTIR